MICYTIRGCNVLYYVTMTATSLVRTPMLEGHFRRVRYIVFKAARIAQSVRPLVCENNVMV